MIQFSLVTKDKGILTKRFDLKHDELVKDGTQCFLKQGKIETIEMEFKDLPKFLDKMTHNQAILHGITIHAPSRVVAKNMLKDHPDAIARTKDNFFWPDEGLVMLDYDPPDNTEPYTKDELLEKVRGLHPELKTAAFIWRPSASSNIVGEDGTIYRALKNQRLYFEYRNPDNMDMFVQNLEKAAWDKGLGHIFITAAGTALPRCVFDTAVFSPERLDFAAGAVCGKGLLKQVIKSTYHAGDIVDFDEIGTLYDDERYVMQVDEAKRDLSVDITEARNNYKTEQATKLVGEDENLSMSRALKIVGSRLKNKIMPKDILYANDMTPIPVMDIILDQEKYNGVVIRDPLEPEYGASKAKIFADEESITINSFAHGGRVFRITLDTASYIHLLEQIEDPEELLAVWTDRISDFTGSQAEKEKVAKYVTSVTGVSKTTLMQDVKAKEKAVREEAADDSEDTNLSHHQISERILAQLPQNTVATEGSLYSYNGANCWEARSMTEVELEVAKRFDRLPRCSRKADYNQISKHLYNLREDPTFFHTTKPVVSTLDACWVFNEETGCITKVKHDPKHRVRFILPFESVPMDTEGPMRELYLAQAFEGEEVQGLVLQEFAGAMMFGMANIVFQKALLLRGDGMNGKNVTVDMLKGLVPPAYVSNVSPFQFGDPLYVAGLSGKMMNVATEMNKGQRIPNAGFKKVIDEGVLTGKRLYQQPFDFPSTAAHIFSSNYPVRTDDGSGGMIRRWLMLRYIHKVAVEDRIPHLGAIIAKNEGPQLFNWAMEGLLRLWQQGDFTRTPSQDYLQKEMFLETDSVSSFLADDDIITVDSTKKLRVLRSGLYNHYRDWCRDNGRRNQEVMSKARFNNRMEDLSFELTRSNGQVWWRGVQLKTG